MHRVFHSFLHHKFAVIILNFYSIAKLRIQRSTKTYYTPKCGKIDKQKLEVSLTFCKRIARTASGLDEVEDEDEAERRLREGVVVVAAAEEEEQQRRIRGEE